MSGIRIMVDGYHGVYVPQVFALNMDEREGTWEGITEEEREILLAGVDNEVYWETWESVMNNASFTNEAGHKWTLLEVGDLFMVCDELMTEAEKVGFYGIEED